MDCDLEYWGILNPIYHFDHDTGFVKSKNCIPHIVLLSSLPPIVIIANEYDVLSLNHNPSNLKINGLWFYLSGVWYSCVGDRIRNINHISGMNVISLEIWIGNESWSVGLSYLITQYSNRYSMVRYLNSSYLFHIFLPYLSDL